MSQGKVACSCPQCLLMIRINSRIRKNTLVLQNYVFDVKVHEYSFKLYVSH